MAERLKLKKTGIKIRLNPFVFVLILILTLAIGYFSATYVNSSAKPVQNCINQSGLQFFIDLSNEYQASYAACLKENWNLKMICEQQAPKANVTKSQSVAPVIIN